jgi:putative FmdB family regulatory protein
MPTYLYQCHQCGEEFEEFQSITAPPLEECPRCAGEVVRKPQAGGGILFKGTGFYITDYRSESYKKAAEKEKSSSAPPKSKPPSPKDTKKKN